MLKHGVHIYADNTQDRLMISNGTAACGNLEVEGLTYDEDAFWPGEWRKPVEEELSVLTGNAVPHFSEDVGVVKLPPHIISLAETLGLKNMTGEADLVKLRQTQTETYMELSSALKKFIAGYTLSKEKQHAIGWVVNNLPNRRTLTINRKTNRYLGLHMDSWEAMTLSNLQHAPNRICINFGREPRYLLMVNLTMAQVYDMVEDSGINFNSIGQDKLTVNFFKRFPEYPVIRIRVNPYEAYIAPTENMIHDGCTEGVSSVDVHYTFRGFINLTPGHD
jgi:hypothetical protein